MSVVLEAAAQHPQRQDAPAHASGRRGLPIASAVPAAIATALWTLSLSSVNVSHLGSYGLPPALPVTWFAALAIALAGAVWAILTRRSSPLMMVGYIALVALILYGTVPALSHQPHYAWVYKHIGVVRYLEAHGTVNPSIDIYNRWPGFFALAAALSAVTGRVNPETYVGWAEAFFVLLDAALVMAAVKTLIRDTRIAAGAALLFLMTNWVGQTYYSPQAFSFLLGLGLIVIVLRQLRVREPGCSPRVARLIERVGRVPQLPTLPNATARWPRWGAVTVVLSLDAVIVASHQLTPYMLLASIALLSVAGMIRPRWLVGLMALITLGYFAANFDYVQRHYGVFTSIDPFNNAQVSAYAETPSAGKAFNTHAQLLAIVALGVVTSWATIRLLRQGLLVRALPLLVLAVSPMVVIFGQNYGGEASLRIILFASPWCSALIAWALATIARRRRRWILTGAVVAGFAALFVPAFLGQEELNIVSSAEVQASAWFYDHARAGTVLVLAAPGFPYKYGASYPQFRGPEGDAFPNLLSDRGLQQRELGRGQIPEVVARITEYAPRGYIAFSKDETAFAEVLKITPHGALRSLESAIASSPQFRLWYRNPDVRIYELAEGSSALVLSARRGR
jgi:hypothetical protein